MPAQQDDIDRIMSVMSAAFDPAYGEAWNRTQVENALLLGHCHYHLIGPDGLAPDQDEATGFALLRRVLDESELLLFAVSPAWRGRGLGARLLTTILCDARESGVQRVLLEMRKGNSAEQLYIAHGFVPIGIRPKYYRAANGERIDAISFACDFTNDTFD